MLQVRAYQVKFLSELRKVSGIVGLSGEIKFPRYPVKISECDTGLGRDCE